MTMEDFESVLKPFCFCNLDRWSESSFVLFKLISIWCVWFFYCYYFAECFVKSFGILSSNIQNDIIRLKCWMKQGVNQSNRKIVFNEPENVEWKNCFKSNFYQTWFFFIQNFQSNISSNMEFLLCWMKCWICLTRPSYCYSQVQVQTTHRNIQVLSSNNFYTLSPLINDIQKGEYTPNY